MIDPIYSRVFIAINEFSILVVECAILIKSMLIDTVLYSI